MEANEQIETLTKEQVVEMSDEEIFLWCAILAKKDGAAQKRKVLLDWLEKKEADRLSIS